MRHVWKNCSFFLSGLLFVTVSILWMTSIRVQAAAIPARQEKGEVIGTAVTQDADRGEAQATARSAEGSMATITPGDLHNYGSWETHEYAVATETGTYLGFCAQPNSPTPSGVYQVSVLDSDYVKAALLYGYNGDYYDPENDGLWAGTKDSYNTFAYTHAIVSYLYAGEATGLDGIEYDYLVESARIVTDRVDAGEADAILRNYTVYVAYNDAQDIVWLEKNPPGVIEVRKSSGNPQMTDANPNYSLAGAVFGIFPRGENTVLATITTDENGYGRAGEIPAGEYDVAELSAPPGYVPDGTRIPVSVPAGEAAAVEVSDQPKTVPAGLLLQKIDKENTQARSQGGASLAGAQFTVKYYPFLAVEDPEASGATPKRSWVFGTDQAGQIHLSNQDKISGDPLYEEAGGAPAFPMGTLTIRETKAPEGYLPCEEVFLIQLSPGEEGGPVHVYQAPTIRESIIRGGVKIGKWDAELSGGRPQGNGTLKGTRIQITTTSEHAVLVEGKTYKKGEVVWAMETDEKGLAETPPDLLPYGTYSYRELAAPQGYLPQGVLEGTFAIRQAGRVVDLSKEEGALKNQIVRGDMELVKVSDGDQKRMAGVPFQITSVTTGESHVIVTDKNGFGSTSSDWNLHSANTNAGKTDKDGVWFGDVKALDDQKGALLYDTYLIEELPCEANKDKVVLEPFEITVYKNHHTIHLGTITNDYKPVPPPETPQEPEKPKQPETPKESPKEAPAPDQPRTGDTQNLTLLILLLILCCAAIFICGRIARKTE